MARCEISRLVDARQHSRVGMIYWFVTHDGVGGAVALRWVNALNHWRWERWEVSTSRTLPDAQTAQTIC